MDIGYRYDIFGETSSRLKRFLRCADRDKISWLSFRAENAFYSRTAGGVPDRFS